MKNIQVIDCLQPELVTLEKVNYFPRQLLTADDMTTERDYILQKMRRHNRFLHGWGVVCGLMVTAAPTEKQPWLVQIGGGYALGPYGDEIYVVEPTTLDLAKCGPKAMTDPCNPGRLRTADSGVGGTIYVAIKYTECLSRPVQAMPAGCGCEDEPCEYSRIRDSFQVTCLTELPPSHQAPKGPSLCDIIHGRALPACPPCPTDPWVVLAKVVLPASPAQALTDYQIDNRKVRRMVFSTAMIQDQLIRCCCGGQRTPDNPPDNPPPPVETKADVLIKIVEKTILDAAPAAGTPRRAHYLLEVANLGPTAADNVVVTAKTTPAMDGTRATWIPSGGWTAIGGDPKNGVTLSLGTMAVNAKKDFILEVALTHTERITLDIAVQTSSNDPDTSNNSAAATMP